MHVIPLDSLAYKQLIIALNLKKKWKTILCMISFASIYCTRKCPLNPSVKLGLSCMGFVLCSLVAACMRLRSIASGLSIAMLVAVVVAVVVAI